MKHTFLLSLLIVSVSAYAADERPNDSGFFGKIASGMRRLVAGNDTTVADQQVAQDVRAILAVTSGDQSRVRAMFEQGTLRLDNEQGPFHVAITQNDEGMVALLTSLRNPSGQGMNCNVTHKGSTPLMLAVLKESPTMVRALHNAGASLDFHTSEIVSPLHIAVGKNACDMIRLLLALGASPNIRCGKHGLTPLHLAAKENLPEAVSALAPHADGAVCCDNGCTPLMLAVRLRKEPAALALIAAGVPVNSTYAVGGYTAAHVAAGRGLLAVLGKLLECANCNIVDNDHYTPLVRALVEKQEPAACMLINGGVQLDIADDNGNTALHVAAENNMVDVVSLLIEKGASATIRNECDKLPRDLTNDPLILSLLNGAMQNL